MTTQSCLFNFSSLRLIPVFCLVFLFFSIFVISFCFDFASSWKFFFLTFLCIFLASFFVLFIWSMLCDNVVFTYTRFNLTSILSTQVLQTIVIFLTCKYSVELVGGPKQTCKRNKYLIWKKKNYIYISHNINM